MILVDAPARQSASAMQTSVSLRSNSGGLNEPSRKLLVPRWETRRGTPVPDIRGTRSVFAPFWAVAARALLPNLAPVEKILMIQRFFKTFLNHK